MSKGARAGLVLVAFAAAIGFILFGVFGYLRSSPPVVSAVPAATQPNTVNVTMQVDGAVGVGPHPTWVGYWIQGANGQYKQTTLFTVPVNTYVHVKLYEYDSGGPLRNPYWGKEIGTAGNVVTVNGQPVTLVNSYAGNGVAHNFDVPGLGINVALPGVNGNAKNFCNVGPCNPSEAHNLIEFTFYSGKTVHNYRWQCFIPCGLGYLNGNGGPMQTLGYMAGFVQVVK